MGKCRSRETHGMENQTQPRGRKRTKRMDTSEMMNDISISVKQKFAWILQNQPIVYCEKLTRTLSSTFEIPRSHACMKLDTPPDVKLSRNKLMRTKEWILQNRKDFFEKGEGKLDESEKNVTPKVIFKYSISSSSQKKFDENSAIVHAENTGASSRPKNLSLNSKISGKGSRNCIPLISQNGSKECEEFLKISLLSSHNKSQRTENGKVHKQSRVKVTECTRDPNRITPCSELCCMQFLNGESKRKKCRKKDENSSSRKTRDFPFHKENSSQHLLSTNLKTQLSQQLENKFPAPKWTKDEKPGFKEKEVKQEDYSKINNFSAEKNSLIEKPKKLIALFTPKSMRLNPQNAPSQHSQNTSMLMRYFAAKKNQFATNNNRPGFSFYLTPCSSGNLISQKSVCSESNNLQMKPKVELLDNNLSIESKSNLFDAKPTLLNKRTKPKEYFPNINSSNTFKSGTKASHPKANVDRHNQTRKLEEAPFPRINNSSTSTHEWLNRVSHFLTPANCQDNRIKLFQSKQENSQENKSDVFPQTNAKVEVNDFNFTNLSNEIGVQSVNNQGNGNLLLENSLDSKVINDFECCPKNRFRDSAVEMTPGNRDDLSEANLEETMFDFETKDVISTTNNDLLLGEEVDLIFEKEFSCVLPPVKEFTEEMEVHQSHSPPVNDSQNVQLSTSCPTPKKGIKITRTESVPSNCIQILPRTRVREKNERELLEISTINDQTFNQENSTCEQEKVAIIKIQNVEQLRKEELPLIQETTSFDYPMISEELMNHFSLSSSQVENAVFNSNLLDHNYDLGNLSCDEFLENDMVQSNEKNIHMNTAVDARESIPNTESRDLSEVIEFLDQTNDACNIVANLANTISSFEDFKKDNASNINGDDTYLVNNLKEVYAVTDTSNPNEYSLNIKEHDKSSQNVEHQGINSDSKGVSSHRKRRWFDEKQTNTVQPRKVKLKRKKWNANSNEGDDYNDALSEISSSCISSVCDNNQSLLKRMLEIDTSANLNLTNFKRVTESSNVNVYESKTESNFCLEGKEVHKEVSQKAESLVDSELVTEPKPENNISDVQLPEKEQKMKSPILEPKKKKGHRSKFSPNCYSSSSSSSDDEFMTKEDPSSDNELEIEGRSNLLNRRIQQELKILQNQRNTLHVEENILQAEKNTAQSQKNGNDCQKIVTHDTSLLDNQEDDVLSVIASPSLMELSISSRCASPVQPVKAVQSNYRDIDDNYWDTFKRKNMDECTYDLRTLVDKKHAEKKLVEKEKDQVEHLTKVNSLGSLFTKPFISFNSLTAQVEHPFSSNENSTTVNQRSNRISVSRIFVGMCYSFLTYGYCMRNVCMYSHEIPNRFQTFEGQSEEQVFCVLCGGITMGFKYYVHFVYKDALKKLSYDLGLKLYIQMNASNLLNQVILSNVVEIMWLKEVPLTKVIEDLAEPLTPGSEGASVLLILAEHRANDDNFWEMLHSLKWKAEFHPRIVSKILSQCINDKRNMVRNADVYDFVVANNLYQIVDQKIWFSFYHLLYEQTEKRSECQKQNFNNVNNSSADSTSKEIASPDGINRTPVHQNPNSNYTQGSEDMDISNSPENDASYRLTPIDNLPSPQYCNKDHENLWKFFDRLGSLQNGLKHQDYKHVISIIKFYVNTDRTLFTRHCHRALVSEIVKSQVHMENIIKISGNDDILDYEYSVQYPTVPLTSIPSGNDWFYCTLKTKILPPPV